MTWNFVVCWRASCTVLHVEVCTCSLLLGCWCRSPHLPVYVPTVYTPHRGGGGLLSRCIPSNMSNTSHWPIAVSMLGHRLRRWPNIEPAMGECLMVTGAYVPIYIEGGNPGVCIYRRTSCPYIYIGGGGGVPVYVRTRTQLQKAGDFNVIPALIQSWFNLGPALRTRQWANIKPTLSLCMGWNLKCLLIHKYSKHC